ncbi:MAG TPA: pyridoxamine 5'-phosphate oxidase family protein [Acidimicrobiales bacterium]|nr:pyridoxamine 5'-phosphate oxidase family protein [Acidimicrobiales bacterium]
MSDAETYVEELSRDECMAVLGYHRFGRLAVVEEGQPDIFPVNYALDGDRIVFITRPGTKLEHASLDRVAFEVDEFGPEGQTATSIVVKGTAFEITGALDEASERERALVVPTWVHPDEVHWVRIVPREVTGRRVHRA